MFFYILIKSLGLCLYTCSLTCTSTQKLHRLCVAVVNVYFSIIILFEMIYNLTDY